MFSYETISKNKEHFKTVTGITVERFKQLFDLVDPGTNCSNLKYYDPSKRKSVGGLPEKKTDTKKTGPKPKLHAIDQLMMTVVWFEKMDFLYPILLGCLIYQNLQFQDT